MSSSEYPGAETRPVVATGSARAAAVLTERVGAAIHVTLNRPESYNALNPDMRDRLIEVFDTAHQSGARAILLRGAGRGFCAGVDLTVPRPPLGAAALEYIRLSTHKLVKAYLSCPLPVVSAVHGVTAGIGLTLALAADFCLTAEDAQFRAAYVGHAIVPDGAIAFLLPRLIGIARTKNLLLRSDTVTGADAADIGLVSETHPAGELMGQAERLVAELCALPTATVTMTKQMLAQAFELDLDATLSTERAYQALAALTDDGRESREAGAARRPPKYAGH